MVRIGNSGGSQQVAISSDGGASWNINYGSSTTDYGGLVAYSADADTIVWSSSTSGVLRSQNQASFSAVTGLASGAVVASDKRNNTVFYGGASGAFYVSINTGAAFSKAGALGSATSVVDIAAHPTVAGTVYVSTDIGIFKSTNYGAAFTQISTALTATQKIALGLGSGTTWNLYAFGNGPAGNRLYASADDGKTWTDIQGSQGFGAIASCRLAGSANKAGQVYVGTNGRGVFYASGTVSGGGGSSSSPTAATSSSATSRSSTISSSTSVRPTTSSTSSTSAKTTSSSTKVTVTSTTTSSPPVATCSAAKYAQCGGTGFTGCTACASGSTCQVQNAYYSQCL